jgi:Spy/CpxP family protein refolding chaperone
MKITRILAGAATLALLALPAGGAQAQMMGGMHGKMGGGMPGLRLLLKAANLTPDQRNQVHDLMRSTHEQIRPLVQQMHQLHEQIADKLAGTGSVTLADLTPLQQQINSIQGQVQQLRLKAALQIRGMLTPDQLSRVAAMHQKMEALHQQMRDIMGAPEGGGPPEGGEGEAPPPMP